MSADFTWTSSGQNGTGVAPAREPEVELRNSQRIKEREVKLAQLRQSIASGTYHVDARELAAAILSRPFELATDD